MKGANKLEDFQNSIHVTNYLFGMDGESQRQWPVSHVIDRNYKSHFCLDC